MAGELRHIVLFRLSVPSVGFVNGQDGYRFTITCDDILARRYREVGLFHQETVFIQLPIGLIELSFGRCNAPGFLQANEVL